MSANYPLEFTLEDGIHVVVNRVSADTYDFALQPKHGAERHFTLLDDDRSHDQKTEHLDFDQLNAVRMFWLKQHNVV